MKKIVAGILAHVDAGKTTLSEGMLYTAGKLKKLGRVDHRNSFLDTHSLERLRGITIFSKQAELVAGQTEITLVDTPGHVDFSAETERTLRVLDYAVLVISGSEGIQAHTETLWRLLRRYHVPTFLFITKTDLMFAGRTDRMAEIKAKLSAGCVDFSDAPDPEEIALLDESLLDAYLENGEVREEDVASLIKEEKLFPCYFGSGLKCEGIDAFLKGLDTYTRPEAPREDFGALVYKIGRDDKGNRLTYLKVTGGSLKVRTPITYSGRNGEDITEKVNQIRIYSGSKFRTEEEVSQGSVCAVVGLSETTPGMGIGTETRGQSPVLEPVLTYRIVLPDDVDAAAFLPKMRQLEEEDPALHVVWDETHHEIHLRLMGAVQIEILKGLVEERFHTDIEIVDGRILYKETIAEAVVGIGHFEPLRHYAEVHLLLEPGETGSGIVFDTKCSEDHLDRNWQRLILGQLESQTLVGVLCGAPVTDLKITLVAGRAHLKHTEGGDFREAATRAFRQGLMQAKSVLLEPYYDFTLAVPGECLGRAIHDIQAMDGHFGAPEEDGEMMVLKGDAPVSAMGSYLTEVLSYTHGKGRLRCEVKGYLPCNKQDAIVAETGYDPIRDTEHPCDSVFCAHGGGFSVPWNEVKDYAHVDSGVKTSPDALPTLPDPKLFVRNLDIDDKELEAIMEREFGPIRRPQYKKVAEDDRSKYQKKAPIPAKHYLVVDGYNMIFAWDALKELAADDIGLARIKLIELLSSYQSFVRNEVILVFDGYKFKGNQGSKEETEGIGMVYTKEGETADMYIEKLLRDMGKHDRVRVATSDALIQISALGSGVLRMSAAELEEELRLVQTKLDAIVADINRRNDKLKNKMIQK
ncbi:MAG: TetM/TetW/TetO/TetS family tetracycline resistance ribosomal protection protein [Firmicutes bacterium]|nr:TetM/TetW/TetO/TetS family tetracycline resistance ribosomal protection protein [Bacillota bacterium]